MNQVPEHLVTVTQAAALLGISMQALAKWRKSNKIEQPVALGGYANRKFYRREYIETLLARNKQALTPFGAWIPSAEVMKSEN